MTYFSFAFLAFLLLLPQTSYAGTRVDILPRKIVVDDKSRSAEITIMNLGEKTGTLRISLINYRQDDKGVYAILDGPLDPKFDPEKVVRISPKQFTLPPGGRQKVRLSIQRPADLPEGEYRFHIKAVSYDTKESLEGKPVPSKGNVVKLDMNIAVAIPVVVRKGALGTGAKLENIVYDSSLNNEYKKPTLNLDITRQGQAGTMGTVYVYREIAGKEQQQIGIISNMNVFAEVKTRKVVVPLTDPNPGQGNIRVVYVNDFDDKGIFDEVVLQK